MEKFVFAVVIGGLVTFAACSKSSTSGGGTGNYTCKCYIPGISTPSSSPLNGYTQAAAQQACNQASATLAATYSGAYCTLQ